VAANSLSPSTEDNGRRRCQSPCATPAAPIADRRPPLDGMPRPDGTQRENAPEGSKSPSLMPKRATRRHQLPLQASNFAPDPALIRAAQSTSRPGPARSTRGATRPSRPLSEGRRLSPVRPPGSRVSETERRLSCPHAWLDSTGLPLASDRPTAACSGTSSAKRPGDRGVDRAETARRLLLHAGLCQAGFGQVPALLVRGLPGPGEMFRDRS
jgi:hypothetical protein